MQVTEAGVYTERQALASDRRLWIWQAVAAGLFVLWLATLNFAYFRAQLIEGQYLLVIRQDLAQAVQSLAQSQQQLNQRLQALEQGPRKGE